MARWLARLLCASDWHRFDYRMTFIGGRQLDQCSRCGQYRNIPVAGLDTPDGSTEK